MTGAIVEILYNTRADSTPIDPEREPYPRTLHGPFHNLDEAIEWMENLPDDTDTHDVNAYLLNDPKERG